MATTNPVLSVQIVGNKIVTDFYSSEELTILGRVERELYEVIVGDGLIAIPITKIGTVSKIVATSTSANIKITHASGDFTLPINGVFVWSVDSVFALTITAIEVSTDSTQALDISISVYGE